MSNIIKLNSRRPHLSVQGLIYIHVIPLSLMRDVKDGKIPITDIEGWEDFLPGIINDFLLGLKDE